MTYSPGDPGHMLAHSDLVAAVNAELTRFGMAADLPTRALGDEGHLDDHNAIRGALATIEATAGKTFGTALPPVRNLGDAGHVDDHTALLACALEASLWPAWNDATGGTITEVDNYNSTGEKWRVHTFDTTAGGTLTVTLAVQPFRVLVVGGGGGAPGSPGPAPNYSHAGGGRGVEENAVTLAAGSYPTTIGAGGGGGPKDSGCGGTGGTTTFHTWSQSGGAGGCISSPGNGVGGPLSDITGTSIQYGKAGVAEAPNPDPGQGGRAQRSSAGGAGRPGAVIVAYRIG